MRSSSASSDTTCRMPFAIAVPSAAFVALFAVESYCGSLFVGDIASGGCFCSLLDCLEGPAGDFEDRDSGDDMDSRDVFGGGDDRDVSDESFSCSSGSSSGVLLFLSFLLNNPLSIPGFLSLRFLSSLLSLPSLPLSFVPSNLSIDSRLGRSWSVECHKCLIYRSFEYKHLPLSSVR